MNKIPLSVSSTLTSLPAAMSSMQVTPYGNNTGKTGTAAPVLIAVESVGTVGVETFAATMPGKGGQGTAAQARLVINALAELLSELVAEYGAITVNTPLGRVDTFVSGSLEYATDPVDPEQNVPFLGVVPGADVMKTFAQIETFVPTAACPASLKRIRDVATGDSRIHATNPFYVQGYGMTYGGAGESVKLLNPLTRAVVCTAAVDAATKSEAQLKCTLPNTAAIAAGDYLMQVLTLAGGTTLWPLELKVNLAEAVAPAPLKHATIDTLAVSADGNVVLTGTNLDGATGYQEEGEGLFTFPVTVRKSATESATVLLGHQSGSTPENRWTGLCEGLTLTAGDEVTASFSTDPAKTAWATETVSKSATVA